MLAVLCPRLSFESIVDTWGKRHAFKCWHCIDHNFLLKALSTLGGKRHAFKCWHCFDQNFLLKALSTFGGERHAFKCWHCFDLNFLLKALSTLRGKDMPLNVGVALRKYGCKSITDIGGKRLVFKC